MFKKKKKRSRQESEDRMREAGRVSASVSLCKNWVVVSEIGSGSRNLMGMMQEIMRQKIEQVEWPKKRAS